MRSIRSEEIIACWGIGSRQPKTSMKPKLTKRIQLVLHEVCCPMLWNIMAHFIVFSPKFYLQFQIRLNTIISDIVMLIVASLLSFREYCLTWKPLTFWCGRRGYSTSCTHWHIFKAIHLFSLVCEVAARCCYCCFYRCSHMNLKNV